VRVSATSEPQTNSADASLALDLRIALFTIADSTLYVALQERTDGFALPRGLPETNESLDAAARRTVRAATHLQEQYLEQLYTFSLPGDGEPRAIIVSYLALLSSGAAPDKSEGMIWTSIPISVELSESDAIVIDYALVRLRAKLGYTNIAFSLLPDTFTLTELQTAYESILGRRLDKRNFRRRTIASGILLETDHKRRDGSHRPATLYRFQSEQDHATYLTPNWSGDE
jgi:8-oxo-dGTP diphosphatase